MPAPLRFLLGLALLAATALADEAAKEAGFITHARQLIFEGRRSGEGAFSPDGKKLCSTSGRTADGKLQLFLADWNDTAVLAALAQSAKVGGASQPRAGERSEAEGKNAHAFQPTAAAGAAPARDSEVPPTVAAISREDLQLETACLADAAREGRATGSEGAKAAADWLAEYFQKAGLKPFGADYFQPFEFTAGERVVPEKCRLAITGAATPDAVLDKDFRPLP